MIFIHFFFLFSFLKSAHIILKGLYHSVEREILHLPMSKPYFHEPEINEKKLNTFSAIQYGPPVTKITHMLRWNT